MIFCGLGGESRVCFCCCFVFYSWGSRGGDCRCDVFCGLRSCVIDGIVLHCSHCFTHWNAPVGGFSS